MNEWERLHQQAKRYQAEYPPGTRIMLLSMAEIRIRLRIIQEARSR